MVLSPLIKNALSGTAVPAGEAAAAVREARGDPVRAERLQRPAGCFGCHPAGNVPGRGGGVAGRSAAEETGRRPGAGKGPIRPEAPRRDELPASICTVPSRLAARTR
jgi:hypothetical protein